MSSFYLFLLLVPFWNITIEISQRNIYVYIVCSWLVSSCGSYIFTYDILRMTFFRSFWEWLVSPECWEWRRSRFIFIGLWNYCLPLDTGSITDFIEGVTTNCHVHKWRFCQQKIRWWHFEWLLNQNFWWCVISLLAASVTYFVLHRSILESLLILPTVLYMCVYIYIHVYLYW